ncbi:dipeptide ABC transporter ATP-binding protein [Bacteroidota bacterium]
MLTVKDLTVSLNKNATAKKLVENISFSLLSGESLGIVGESGSGKTITALSILQLLPPGMMISGGQIFLGSTDLTKLSEKQMQGIRGKMISMIFQEPMSSLNPSMSAGDQIREALSLHLGISASDARDRTLSLLDEVQLPPEIVFYRKYPHQLSGGQRQRIMIAMALAGNPDILIADEPTTALDVTVQKKILKLLHEIQQKRQMSMLFISHDLGVVRSVCENGLIMYKGTIVESGKVSELFDNPKHPYTRGLIACRPLPGSNPHRLPTLADFMPEDDAPTLIEKPDKSQDAKTESQIEKPESKAGKVGSKREDIVADNTDPPLLEVRNLKVVYILKKNFWGNPVRDLHAVNDVSFGIYPGETLGLIGESGCGKSTLGRSLIRLIQSQEGEILFRGKPVSSLNRKELDRFRREVQFIFQDPFSSLNPSITIGSSIMEVMRVHRIHRGIKKRRTAALDLLVRVGLGEEHFMRYPHEFSGGQRQRIGLARVLATSPKLIICDESVSSLDVSVQARILNLLNDLKDSLGLTYLFISHDLSVVRYMSGHILVMKDGKLMEQGSGEEIFTNPASEYTKELIDSIPG